VARLWLFASGGAEHGPVRRIRNATAVQGRPYIEGAYGRASGYGGNPPEKTTVGSGYFAHKESVAGFTSVSEALTGHVETLGEDWIFWCGRVVVSSMGGDPGTDTYVFARCTDDMVGGGGDDDYLGVGFACNSQTTFKFIAMRFDGLGVFETSFANTITDNGIGGPFTMGSTVYFWVLGYDPGNNNCQLWITPAGGSELTNAVAGTISNCQTAAPVLKDNRYVAGTKSDQGSVVYNDCLASCEGSADTDRPTDAMRQILYQPNADVVSGWASGTYCDVDDENDTSVGDGDTDSNVITPGAANQYQIFGFPDLVSEPTKTATVEAVLLIWEQQLNGSPGSYTGHTPKARLTGEAYESVTTYGSGAQGEPTTLEMWFARFLRKSPEGTPAIWTPTKFNALEWGLYSADTKPVGELYAIVLGNYVARPTANTCAVGEARSQGLVI